MAEKNRIVAVLDFILGLVELGAAYALYEVYSAVNASFLSSSSVMSGLSYQAASNLILVILLVGVFVAIHGVKRVVENIAVFWRVAVASSRAMAANLPQSETQ